MGPNIIIKVVYFNEVDYNNKDGLIKYEKEELIHNL